MPNCVNLLTIYKDNWRAPSSRARLRHVLVPPTEHALAAFAGSPKGGLIVLASGLGKHRDLFIALAARHSLPAVYPFPYYVSAGGLICYGPDSVDQYRRAAGYVDRILKGGVPGNLPVQMPIKYSLTINLKTAKALGLTIPPALLARAEEVIE